MNYLIVISSIYHAREVKGYGVTQRKLISVLWFDNVYFEQEPGPNFTAQRLSDFQRKAEKCALTGVVKEARTGNWVTKSHMEHVGRCEKWEERSDHTVS